MTIPYVPILFLSVLACLVIGAFLYLKPALAIKIQIKFYEKINWRMEPVSMEKEIRNTKIMGLFLFGVALGTFFYLARGTAGKYSAA